MICPPFNVNIIGAKSPIFCNENYIFLYSLSNQKPIKRIIMVVR